MPDTKVMDKDIFFFTLYDLNLKRTCEPDVLILHIFKNFSLSLTPCLFKLLSLVYFPFLLDEHLHTCVEEHCSNLYNYHSIVFTFLSLKLLKNLPQDIS